MSNRSNVQSVAVGAGAVLIAAFFLPFISYEGFSVSAWGLVKHADLAWTTKAILLAIPVGGLALLLCGLDSDKTARRASLATGASVLGYLFFKLAWGFLKITGVGLWLTIAAAIVALVAGMTGKAKAKTE